MSITEVFGGELYYKGLGMDGYHCEVVEPFFRSTLILVSLHLTMLMSIPIKVWTLGLFNDYDYML